LGKIISRPTVVVVNGQLGRTQVGSDIAIKERDFAGNLIDRFYSTGTIIEVKPYIYKEDGVDYVYLDTKVEKSSVLPSATLTEITKTAATTKILLLDGEEVAIGGLFVNDESNVRRGVPFLKDLPWWFFGLRYIFGYDETAVTTKEIIMLIKVNILPTLKERIDQKKQDQVLSKEWQNQTDDLQKYKEEIEKAKAERKQEMEKKQNEESEEK
jgi:type IV pilus assembly protein PilQ